MQEKETNPIKGACTKIGYVGCCIAQVPTHCGLMGKVPGA